MAARWVVVLMAVAASGGCYVSYAGDAGPACATSTCGCYEKQQMTFTGQVMDARTGECIRGKLVRLRDRDGRVVSEDTSRSPGTYTLNGQVDRSPNCPGGEPVVRDDPDPGQSLPTYAYLPRRIPVNATSEQVDLLRVPYGTTDAGTGIPALCTPPAVADAGM